jgi:hypothetical protein
MSCRKMEKWIIESSEEDLSPEKLSELRQHLSHCTRCARFKEDLQKIRIGLNELPSPLPSVELERRTRLMCQTALNHLKKAERKATLLIPLSPLPKTVWAALILIIILTSIWALPSLKQFPLDQTSSFHAWMVLGIIIQNVTMLIFSPLLLRKHRWRKQWTEFV